MLTTDAQPNRPSTSNGNGNSYHTESAFVTKEEYLRVLQERDLLLQLIDNLPDSIYAKDTSGRFLISNRKNTELLGKSDASEVIGKTDFDFYDRELAEKYRQDELALLSSGQDAVHIEEPNFNTTSGEKRWILTTKVVRRDEYGTPIGLFGIGRDITLRKQTEEALRQSEETFRKMANTLPGMIYQILFHPDGKITYPFVSEGSRAIYGIAPEVIMQDSSVITKMWHPDDIGEYMRRVEECRRTLQPFNMDCRIVFPDGRIKWLHIQSTPQLEPGGYLRFYGVRTDITAQKEAEAKLRLQQQQMIAAADLAKLAFWECDLSRQTFIFNAQVFMLLGTSLEKEGSYEIGVQDYLGRFVLAEDVPETVKHLEMVLSSKDLMRGEATYRIRRADDGSIRYLKVIYNIIRNAEGIPVQLFGPIQDITDQKLVEAKLLEQQTQMNAAADLAQLAFWESDLQRQSSIFNERCFALLGTSLEKEGSFEISTQDYFSRFVLAEDVPEVLQNLQAVLSRPDLKRGVATYRIRRIDDGSIRYIKLIYNVERNEDGLPVRLFGPMQDITDQKQAEEALRRSEETFRKTVNAVPGMIYQLVSMPDGTFQMPYVSSGCRTIFGLEPEAIMNDSMILFGTLHPEDVAAMQVAVSESAANLLPFTYEVRHILPSGKQIWTRYNAQPHLREDGAIVWYGVCVDITRLKELEAELRARLKEIQDTQKYLIQTEKMSALGQMVAGVAHELNTPIGYASNNVSIIRDRFKNISSLLRKAIEAQECIYNNQLEQAFVKMQEVSNSPNGTLAELDETIRRTDRLFAGISSGFEQMSNLVKSMRNFSRLDEAEMKKADINEGLRNCLLMIGHKLKDKNIELITEYGDLPMVDCYPAQLNQVFLNLIDNAIHAAEERPNGQIRVKSSLEQDYIIVSVTDNGKGIPKHVQSKIFDPFFTTKPVGKGTGLGLSICYNIVQKHKGELYFETEEGVGTTFFVKIPAVDFLDTQS